MAAAKKKEAPRKRKPKTRNEAAQVLAVPLRQSTPRRSFWQRVANFLRMPI